MDRLLIMCGLAFLVSCGGALRPAAAPAKQDEEGAPVLNSTPPAGIETPSLAPPAQPLGPVAEKPAEIAPTPKLQRGPRSSTGTSRSEPRVAAVVRTPCHAPDMAQASSAYDWLERRGYIAGTKSPIASATNSCLQWFGGNMPPRGKPNEQAARDLSAWVAAGALNND